MAQQWLDKIKTRRGVIYIYSTMSQRLLLSGK